MIKTIFLRRSVISYCYYPAKPKALKSPMMGWSSWNNFRIHIDEKLIREQADAMISSGLYDAGYRYVNIDDGYFEGRDNNGKLFADAENLLRE